MKWPFSRKDTAQEFIPFHPVVLSEEEQNECQRFWDSVTKVEGGSYCMKEDVADAFQRSMVAMCLMGRAERFLARWESDHDGESREQACTTAAKACAIYPLSLNFFDFGCLLQGVGKNEEAKIVFTEFLRRQGTGPSSDMDRFAMKHRDIEAAVKYATEQVS